MPFVLAILSGPCGSIADKKQGGPVSLLRGNLLPFGSNSLGSNSPDMDFFHG